MKMNSNVTYGTSQENDLEDFFLKIKEESLQPIKAVFQNFFSKNSIYECVLLEHNNPRDKIKLTFFTGSFEERIDEYIKQLAFSFKNNVWGSSEKLLIQLINPLNGVETEKFVARKQELERSIQIGSRNWLSFNSQYDLFYKLIINDSEKKSFSPYRRGMHKKDGLDIFQDYNSLLTGLTENGCVFDSKGNYYRGIEYVR